MAYLRNLAQVRSVNWAREYLWDVKFPDGPYPFSDWFPATDYDYQRGSSVPFTLTPPMSDYRVPMMTSSSTISLTYLDDVNNTLYNWLCSWYDDIFDESRGILPLELAVKDLTIAQLKLDRSILSVNTFKVFPISDLSKRGGSGSSTVPTSTISLAVAGKS